VFFDSDFPPASNVVFTGPAGSGITSKPADADESEIDEGFEGRYRVTRDGASGFPGGKWTVLYKGQGLRYRMLGGGYKIVARGSGIALSAVGKGTVMLDGEPRFAGDDVGVYSSTPGVDCSAEPLTCMPLPTEPERFALEPPPAEPNPRRAP